MYVGVLEQIGLPNEPGLVLFFNAVIVAENAKRRNEPHGGNEPPPTILKMRFERNFRS